MKSNIKMMCYKVEVAVHLTIILLDFIPFLLYSNRRNRGRGVRERVVEKNLTKNRLGFLLRGDAWPAEGRIGSHTYGAAREILFEAVQYTFSKHLISNVILYLERICKKKKKNRRKYSCERIFS